jgi:hypothetical protein
MTSSAEAMLRMTPLQLLTAAPDTLLGLLFVFAFFKTRRAIGTVDN